MRMGWRWRFTAQWARRRKRSKIFFKRKIFLFSILLFHTPKYTVFATCCSLSPPVAFIRFILYAIINNRTVKYRKIFECVYISADIISTIYKASSTIREISSDLNSHVHLRKRKTIFKPALTSLNIFSPLPPTLNMPLPRVNIKIVCIFVTFVCFIQKATSLVRVRYNNYILLTCENSFATCFDFVNNISHSTWGMRWHKRSLTHSFIHLAFLPAEWMCKTCRINL